MTLEELYLIFDAIHPDENGCRIWPYGKDRCGYGFPHIGHSRKYAHRVALERKLGVNLPPTVYALHTCDVPSCVNPEHLYAGTPGDNMRDMKKRGRGRNEPIGRNRAGANNPMFGKAQSLKSKLIVQMNNIMRFHAYWGA